MAVFTDATRDITSIEFDIDSFARKPFLQQVSALRNYVEGQSFTSSMALQTPQNLIDVCDAICLSGNLKAGPHNPHENLEAYVLDVLNRSERLLLKKQQREFRLRHAARGR